MMNSPSSSSMLAAFALDRDHPGFQDATYRRRRNKIAALALAHRPGDPIEEVAYSDDEIRTWDSALEALTPLHTRYACDEFQRAWSSVGFQKGHVPAFREINQLLAPAGFRFEPVAGLVTPRVFMEKLADGVFLATQYMRHHSMPLYTPEPDVIHEFIGHVPLLRDPVFAELNRQFGMATKRASDAMVEELIRLYWYVLEFGVVGTPGNYRVIGAGLFSSFGELGHFETRAKLLPFSIEAVSQTPFDTTDYQSTLFVAKDVPTLARDLTNWLGDIS